MKKVIVFGALGVLTILCVFLWHSEAKAPAPTQVQTQEPALGATIPVVVTRFQTSLQASITSAATSMTLVAATDSAGNLLSGYTCFTIDEGTSVAEDVCGSASGTAVTALTRGISPTTGTSSVASLEFAHRRGASVKITDAPQLPILSRILNGNETLPNPLIYDSGVSTTTLQGNGEYLANVNYVNSVSVAGAPNATTTARGIVQFATGAQVSLGTIQGSTGAFLAPPNWIFNSTAGSATTVPVTGANGKLAQGFLDLTQAFTWTGAHIFNSATTTLNATTTIAASASNKLILNGVPYSFPSSQGTATSTLINNGSGTLSWITLPQYATSTNTSLATSFGTSATTVVASFTFTPPVAGRYEVNFVDPIVTGGTQGDNCQAQFFIDKLAQTGVDPLINTVAAAAQSAELSYSFVTSQVSSSQHTFDFTVQGGAHTCTGNANAHASMIFIGN